MLQPLGEETLTPMSNAPRKGRALNHSHLLPLTKTNENPTKT